MRGFKGKEKYVLKVPKSWVRYSEAAHRAGVATTKITAWVRHGYLTGHKILKYRERYVCWDELMQNKFCRRQYDKFQKELAAQAKQDLPSRKPKFPEARGVLYK